MSDEILCEACIHEKESCLPAKYNDCISFERVPEPHYTLDQAVEKIMACEDIYFIFTKDRLALTTSEQVLDLINDLRDDS